MLSGQTCTPRSERIADCSAYSLQSAALPPFPVVGIVISTLLWRCLLLLLPLLWRCLLLLPLLWRCLLLLLLPHGLHLLLTGYNGSGLRQR